MAEAPRAVERALEAYRRFYRAFRWVQREADTTHGSHDLTPSQFATLEALQVHGALRQTDLAALILRSGGNLTLVIDNLERRGLVTRYPGTSDRRVKLVRLTAVGASKISSILPEHANRIRELMGRLSPGEQAELARLCRKLDRGGRR